MQRFYSNSPSTLIHPSYHSYHQPSPPTTTDTPTPTSSSIHANPKLPPPHSPFNTPSYHHRHYLHFTLQQPLQPTKKIVLVYSNTLQSTCLTPRTHSSNTHPSSIQHPDNNNNKNSNLRQSQSIEKALVPENFKTPKKCIH